MDGHNQHGHEGSGTRRRGCPGSQNLGIWHSSWQPYNLWDKLKEEEEYLKLFRYISRLGRKAEAAGSRTSAKTTRMGTTVTALIADKARVSLDKEPPPIPPRLVGVPPTSITDDQ